MEKEEDVSTYEKEEKHAEVGGTEESKPKAEEEEEEKPESEEKIKSINNVEVVLEKWVIQKDVWPKRGCYIIGQYDDESIIVYQAFNKKIGVDAVKYQKFEGCLGYSESRMTWIKPNFLWIMFRSNWAKRTNQECILAIYLKRTAFERMLSQATLKGTKGTKVVEGTKTKKGEKIDRKYGRIRLQWDPDHLPNGEPYKFRRALQLGIKQVQTFINGEDIVKIVDVTYIAERGRELMSKNKDWESEFLIPKERVYPLTDPKIIKHIGLSDK